MVMEDSRSDSNRVQASADFICIKKPNWANYAIEVNYAIYRETWIKDTWCMGAELKCQESRKKCNFKIIQSYL